MTNTMDNNELKNLVKEKYGQLADKSDNISDISCGCHCSCSSDSVMDQDYSIFSEDYSRLEGYNPDADLSLGCGIPTEFAQIKEGDTVLDLGSGAGNDCFVARSIVGEKGKVIGLDFTEEMVTKARKNNLRMGFQDLEFILGDIEDMPVSSESVDVVISNCVLNLVPDKVKAFREIYRVLKPGGHLCVSDIVLQGELPEYIKEVAVLYAGCVSGAVEKQDYLRIIGQEGFTETNVVKDRKLELPDDLLLQFMDPEKVEAYRKMGTGIYSITVYAKKP